MKESIMINNLSISKIETLMRFEKDYDDYQFFGPVIRRFPGIEHADKMKEYKASRLLPLFSFEDGKLL